MHFQIDWASFIAGGKFTVFALFYFVFGGNFPSTSSLGSCIWRPGRFKAGVFALPLWVGLIFGGAYFRNFTVYQYIIYPIKYSFLKRLLLWQRLDSRQTGV